MLSWHTVRTGVRHATPHTDRHGGTLLTRTLGGIGDCPHGHAARGLAQCVRECEDENFLSRAGHWVTLPCPPAHDDGTIWYEKAFNTAPLQKKKDKDFFFFPLRISHHAQLRFTLPHRRACVARSACTTLRPSSPTPAASTAK